MMFTSFAGPGEFPQLLESSLSSSTFFMQFLSLVSYAEVIQFSFGSLSGGVALNIDVCSMCSWERTSSMSSYTAILGTPF